MTNSLKRTQLARQPLVPPHDTVSQPDAPTFHQLRTAIMWIVCEISGESLRTVILRHELPDGSHHFDWLLATDPDATLPLTTWRCERPVHEFRTGESMAMKPLADHRPQYLEYEGPVSGDRGSVRRIATGAFTADSVSAERSEIHVAWQHEAAIVTQTLSLTRWNGENWIITCVKTTRHPRILSEGIHDA